MKNFIQYFLGAVMIVAGCTEQETVDLSPEAYYPLKVGQYQVYDVEEIRYSAFNPPEEFAYQLRVEIVDSFKNLEGGLTFVIYRSTRANSTLPWVVSETWSARFNGQYMIESEGNVPYAKLVFPLQTNSSWDGNRYNQQGEDLYTLESIGSTYTVTPDKKFPSSIVVRQSDENSLVFRDERIEVYTSGIGLSFKESKVYQYNTVGGLPGTQIVGGYYWKQVLLEEGSIN